MNYDYTFTEKESTAQLIQTLGSLYKTSIDETIRLLDITQLETFAEHIYQARFTYILTTNTNLQAAENFARKMEEIGMHIHVAGELLQQRLYCASAKQGDVAIILSYAGISDHVQECVKQLYENKVTVLLLSSRHDKTLHYFATCRLYLCGFDPGANRSTPAKGTPAPFPLMYLHNICLILFIPLSTRRIIRKISSIETVPIMYAG